MLTTYFTRPTLAIVLVLALVGCKSDAERADEYFRSGLELMQSGDVDRAMVQFRNVFEFEPGHIETRQVMAEHFMSTGNPRAAFGQYLAIAEQHPDNFEARRALAELAFVGNGWDEFERHGTVAVSLQPEDPRVKAIDLGLKYRAAALAEDEPAREALVAPAEALLAELPDNAIVNNLLVDSYVREGNLTKALDRLDALLAASPEDRQLANRRLALLLQMQDLPGIEEQLLSMVEQFPGDEEVYGMMLRFFVTQDRMDEAEAFLRGIADPADEDPGIFLSLIQLVEQRHGVDAARKEIERAVAESPKPNRFKAMLAMNDFQSGQREQAIADMEAILAEADQADPENQAIKTTLARMLVSTGNEVGARRLVEEVLAQNPASVDGLKMQASWQLQADETEAAIANLRMALDTAPDDIQIMYLMNEAYTRTGETDLARDYLAQAVQASGNAPEPSLRYARLLMSEERYRPAEDVLLPALRQEPGNVEILTMLGRLYLAMDDIPRATQVIDTLRRIDTERSNTVANELQAESLRREGGSEEALKYLEGLASAADAGVRDKLVLMRARLQVGETQEALKIAEEVAAENPDNLDIRQALASTQMAAGDLEAAKASFRTITDSAPDRAINSWLQLMRIAIGQGKPEEADEIVEEALEATNSNGNILWAKASRLENKGDYDGAIAIYEELYDKNSGSLLLANNLASMLATYKSDEASLERAWTVGRRLRDIDNPATQDTYGWILFRRGDVEAAVPYLEKAAAGLSDDPVVQAHLGFAYAALGRNEEALEQMQKAVDIAGPTDTRDQIETARAEITRLRALPKE